LSTTAAENALLVEDAVLTLTAAVEGDLDARSTWQAKMQRAAGEYDERTAESLTRGLLEALHRDHDDRASAEALLVLGLAFGRVLDRHRATFANEGRRLALVFERSGDVERARGLLEELTARMPADPNIERDLTAVLRRTGGTGVLVEKYLRRAEEAAARGKPTDAIVWLQEVVLIDKNRRDVARMIRDLRYQQKERKTKNRRRLKIAAYTLAVLGIAGYLVDREQRIAAAYDSFAPAREGDIVSLQARLSCIDRLIDDEHVWTGLLGATKERNRLEREIELVQNEVHKAERERELARAEIEEQAEDLRTSGLSFAEHGQFDAALADFRRALDLASPTWEHRSRVQADVDAIEAWRKKNR
jgi:tetratricopeptide (TPR) repeat protein